VGVGHKMGHDRTEKKAANEQCEKNKNMKGNANQLTRAKRNPGIGKERWGTVRKHKWKK